MRNVRRVSSKTEYFAGFDLSLTGTAITIGDQNGNVIKAVTIKSKNFGAKRLDEIQTVIRKLIAPYTLKMVCIEGYSFGSTNNREVMGELGGVVRLLLYRMGNPPFKTPTPNQVKKFVTGHGGGEAGSKDQVTLYCFKNWRYTANNNNEADSHVLYRIAMALEGHGDLAKHQKEVVRDVLDPPKKKKKKKKGDED